MKLIEPNKSTVEKDAVGKTVGRLRAVFQIGKTDEHVEDAIIARFLKGMDNRFTMLYHLQLEEKGEPFAPILVGPAGLFVLNICHAKGFFRAKEDAWLEMNKTTHKYGPARPNLIKHSKEIAQRLGQILEARGKTHPEITPILIFANPGVNVETSNPTIRIVLMDGIDSLIDSFLGSQDVLNITEINYIADSLEIMANPDAAIPLGEGEDFFGRDLLIAEEKKPLKLPDLSAQSRLSMPPIEEKLKFSQRQWTILVILLVVTIVILIFAIMYALGIF